MVTLASSIACSGSGGTRALQRTDAERAEHTRHQEHAARDDEQREPGREHERQRRGACREQEAEREQREHGRADEQRSAKSERGDLLLELEEGKLELELGKRHRVIGEVPRHGSHAAAVVSAGGGHDLSNRSPSRS